MNYLKTIYLSCFMLLAGVVSAQQVSLSGPSSSTICDLATVKLIAQIEILTEDLTVSRPGEVDQPLWRYTFEWLNEDGQQIYFHDSNYAVFFYPPKTHILSLGNYSLYSGLYKVVFRLYKRSNGVDVLQHTSSAQKYLTITGDILNFDASRVKGLVSGDFDHDGIENDILACYDHGNDVTKFYVWRSDGTKMVFDWDWYTNNQFNANLVEGRFVSGDFDADGVVDDIAAIYDYGNNVMKILIWTSTGSSMAYQGAWYSNPGSGPFGYNAQKIKGRVVAGDFDNDTKRDDLAVFYDYGGGNTKIHVFRGNTTSMSYMGAWFTSAPGNFNANAITERVVSGNFDNDDYFDDIMVYYEYNNSQTKALLFKSNGSSINGPFTWYDSQQGNYNGQQIKGRVVAADFDDDGYQDDVVAFYDQGNLETRMHYWRGDQNTFSGVWSLYNSGAGNFDANNITNLVVSGDFDHDNVIDDVITMYEYDFETTALFQWKSIGAGNTSWYERVWEVCGNPYNKQAETTLEEEVIETTSGLSFDLYPNPAQDLVKIKLTGASTATVTIYSIDGRMVQRLQVNPGISQIDLHEQPKGLYIVDVVTETERMTKKLMVR